MPELTSIKIGDLGNVITGKTPPSKSSEYWDGEYPFITPTDISDDSYRVKTGRYLSLMWKKISPRYLLPKDASCFVCIGATIGKVCLVDRPSFCNQQINAVVPDTSKYNSLYVFYLLNTLREEVKNRAGGAATPIVNKSSFSDIDIAVLPKDDQDRIADILSIYDNLIENNNRRIAILQEIAQSLYREWFVKFRFPGHENTKFIESSLGKIPESWGVARLDDFIVLQRGFDLPKKKRNEEGDVPVYAASGINGFHDEVKVKGPGLVTGRSGTLGVIMLVLEDFWPLNTSLWVKEFKNCSAYYGYYLLSSIGLEGYNSGAAVPTLNRNYVHGLPVISPPIDLIDEFEGYVSSDYRSIDVLKKKNEILKKQRDLLLPKLISGSIQL